MLFLLNYELEVLDPSRTYVNKHTKSLYEDLKFEIGCANDLRYRFTQIVSENDWVKYIQLAEEIEKNDLELLEKECFKNIPLEYIKQMGLMISQNRTSAQFITHRMQKDVRDEIINIIQWKRDDERFGKFEFLLKKKLEDSRQEINKVK